MRSRLATQALAVVAAVALFAFAWWLPDVRRAFVRAVVTYDARPAAPAPLPGGSGPGLAPVPRTRVAVIDGLGASTAALLPNLSRLCQLGTTLEVDTGFPTVSLPVEVALWTGLTQQQTGVVYRAGRPLDPPLGPSGIPGQVAGSWAVAEAYGYIVRSLGFARAEPAADPIKPSKDLAPDAWADQWQERAREAVTSASPLVFVHILRVDTAGHRHGVGLEYLRAAYEADAIVGELHAADPGARWFLLSDHGHLPGGGHGGEEALVRHVRGCLLGPGVEVAKGGLVHVVDIARAIADSTGATLDRASRGRPLSAAMVSPLHPDQSVPPIALGAGALAIFLLVAGIGLSSLAVRHWWLAPWWFVVCGAALLVLRGVPTLSTPMVYRPEGRDMSETWLSFLGAPGLDAVLRDGALVGLPLIVIASVTAYHGLRHTTLLRVLVAQLALPLTAAAAALTAAGAWPTLLGAELAPIVPRFTAWASPLLLMVAHGAAAVGLGVLASVVLRAFGRRGSAEPPRTEPAAG